MVSPSDIKADDPAYLYLNLQPGEQVVLFIRHYWAGFLDVIFIILGMALFPVVFLTLFHFSNPVLISHHHITITAFLTCYYLLVLTILFGQWVNFYFDLLLVTDQRIIHINQKGLLARETSELDLREIEDVTADVNGILRSFLNYGMLVIETAGSGTGGDKVVPGYFTIADIPNPNMIARTILELRQKLGGGDLGE